MAKGTLKSYKFQTVPAGNAWEACDEYVADEDIVILGFEISGIGRGTDGAGAISKSGVIDASIQRQDDVLYYQEIAGGAAAAHVLSHGVIWYPSDNRPKLDEGDRIYFWVENGLLNIQHAVMWFYNKR